MVGWMRGLGDLGMGRYSRGWGLRSWVGGVGVFRGLGFWG